MGNPSFSRGYSQSLIIPKIGESLPPVNRSKLTIRRLSMNNVQSVNYTVWDFKYHLVMDPEISEEGSMRSLKNPEHDL
jgi:hypothetical protein